MSQGRWDVGEAHGLGEHGVEGSVGHTPHDGGEHGDQVFPGGRVAIGVYGPERDLVHGRRRRERPDGVRLRASGHGDEPSSVGDELKVVAS